MRYWLLAVVLVGCSNDASKAKPVGGGSDGSSSTKRGSAGSFSASLSADLAKDPSSAPKTGSDAKTGSDLKTGSAAQAGSDLKTATTIDAGAAQADAKLVVAAADARVDAKIDSKPDAKTNPKPGAENDEIVMTPEHHGPVKPSGDLAAIKFELLPNWERDIDEAGTIVLSVKIHGDTDPRTFTFHYGYDDARAPADRDAYKKFLADAKLLDVKLDRQRGSAWYLEGTDGNGRPAFRYLINYGGKHLVCFGTLYKDSELGDLRDEVVIQVKKICETMSL